MFLQLLLDAAPFAQQMKGFVPGNNGGDSFFEESFDFAVIQSRSF
jgi:hypothetical protein